MLQRFRFLRATSPEPQKDKDAAIVGESARQEPALPAIDAEGPLVEPASSSLALPIPVSAAVSAAEKGPHEPSSWMPNRLFGFAESALEQAGDSIASGSRQFVDGVQGSTSFAISAASAGLSMATTLASQSLTTAGSAANSALGVTALKASQVSDLAATSAYAVIEGAKEGAGVASETLVAATAYALSSSKDLLGTYAGPAALEFVNDDALVADIAAKLYPLLPTTVQFVVREETFINFLLGHRHHLVAILELGSAETRTAEEQETPAS